MRSTRRWSCRSIRASSSTAIATRWCRAQSSKCPRSTPVPGNMNLEPEERRARQKEILEPYHARIAQRAGPASKRRAADDDRRHAQLHARSSRKPRGPGTSACSTIAMRRSPRSCSICFGARMVSSSATTSRISSATSPTIRSRSTARSAACRTSSWRSGRTSSPSEEGQREWADRLVRLLPRAWEIFRARTPTAATRTPA